jgi:hypothetical protein
MKLIFIVLTALVLGFGLGFAADNLFSQRSAPWSQQRDMQGCWMAGTDRLLVRQGDRKSRFLEAQVGDGGLWVLLDTSIEGDQTIATPRGASGALRLSPDADRLLTSGFGAASITEWVRCETLQTDWSL